MRRLKLFCALAFFAILAPLATALADGEYGTKADAAALVHRAIARVAEVGMTVAAPELMDRTGKFVDRDVYLVVVDKSGVRVVHGQNPKLVGKTYYDAIDVNGKEYGKDVMAIGAGPGKGWVSFMFKDPITGKVLPKENYVEKAGDYIYLAGVYTR
ncbi:MAG: cache domain-containing protein [Acetobacteraceae bacterium]